MGNTPDDQGAFEHARRLSATYRSRLEEQARDLLAHPEHRLSERDRAQMLGALRNLLADLSRAMLPVTDLNLIDQQIAQIVDAVGKAAPELVRPDLAEAVRIRYDAHRLASAEPEQLAALKRLYPADPLDMARRDPLISTGRLVDAYRGDCVRRRDGFGDVRLLLEDIPHVCLEALLWRVAAHAARAGWLAAESAAARISALMGQTDHGIAERPSALAAPLLSPASGDAWMGLLGHRSPDVWVATLALRTQVPARTLWRLIALQELPILDAVLQHAGAGVGARAAGLSLLSAVLRPTVPRPAAPAEPPAIEPLLAALRLPPAIGDAG